MNFFIQIKYNVMVAEDKAALVNRMAHTLVFTAAYNFRAYTCWCC